MEALIFIIGLVTGFVACFIILAGMISHWKERFHEVEKRSDYFERWADYWKHEEKRLREYISEDGEEWKTR